MVTGIVLVNVKRPQLKTIINDLQAVDGISEVYPVIGEYDLVVMVKAKDKAQLSDVVVHKMTHEIAGITHTKTLLSLDQDAKVNLSEVFC